MVTIHYKKHLAGSCLFLLGYSFFFLVHVASGSYDHAVSGIAESEPSINLDENYNNRLSNNAEEPSLTENYHSRRSSRSAEENATLQGGEGARAEATWEPERKRIFERSIAGSESDKAAELIEETLKKNDAISKKIAEGKSIAEDVKSGQMHPKNKKNSKNVEILEEAMEDPSMRWISTSNIPQSNIFQELLKLKDRLRTKSDDEQIDDENGDISANDEDINNDFIHDDDEDQDENGKGNVDIEEEFERRENTVTKPPVEEKKEPEADPEDFDQNAVNGSLSLYQLITNVFLPAKSNCSDDRPHPWRALTSSQYAKQISKQEGPNLSHTTKETKSKLSLIFGSDPVVERIQEKPPSDAAKVHDVEAARNSSSELPIKFEINMTTALPPVSVEVKPVAQALVQPSADNLDANYRNLDTTLLILTKAQDPREPLAPRLY